MSKRVPNEERRVSTTFAVSQITIKMIDGISVRLYGAENGKISHRFEEA